MSPSPRRTPGCRPSSGPSRRSGAIATVLAACAVVLSAAPAAAQSDGRPAKILYDQNFENPNQFRNDGDDVNIRRTVNDLYGDQPPGFRFQQNFTTEVLNITGSSRGRKGAAFRSGYSDPSSKGGDFCIGMLSDRQDDRLGLSFDLQGARYLNVGVDVSSIDISSFSGPFLPRGGVAPLFRFTLYDNPGGRPGLQTGRRLAVATVRGKASPRSRFDWTNDTLSLDASEATNGKVILQVDLVEGIYAAFDNLRIVASDIAGDLAEETRPEPPEPPRKGRAYRGG